ncbi:sugar O-acetyltransferase [Demequina oxidasica]|uniref:sugar O-acetyltransferase n=1 Tax=Demequina oxidasica TaxID=676199 RepID=UPI000AEF01A6|nr:sugar O-acetyltransferase [Demequina oxidasica]
MTTTPLPNGKAAGRTNPVEDPTRSDREKMLAGEWFKYRAGPELADAQRITKGTCQRLNELYPVDPVQATQLLTDLLDECGPGLDFRPPFSIEYQERVRLGSNVFINTDFMVLGGGLVTIGDNVLIGPDARLYTPNHPADLDLRRAGWEIGLPITIEDDVWLGGSVVICPGVSIGRGSIVGAGSVVTKDVPPGVIAGGNPAKVLREL